MRQTRCSESGNFSTDTLESWEQLILEFKSSASWAVFLHKKSPVLQQLAHWDWRWERAPHCCQPLSWGQGINEVIWEARALLAPLRAGSA